MPILGLCCMFSFFAAAALPQQEQTDAPRKVVSQVTPAYPSLARTMNITGSVRLEAVVASNGKVKAIEVKGGHPVLAQAAVDAIEKWRWEPASHETRETVEVKFIPQ